MQFLRNYDTGLSSNKEIYASRHVLAAQIFTVDRVFALGEARVVFGGEVGARGCRYGAFSAVLGEEADGCVTKSCNFDRAAIACVYRWCFAAGDDSVSLIYVNAAFAVLASGKAVA